MIDAKGRVTCDAEIGSVKNGWHSCGRKATCESWTERYSITLHWCERHRHRGNEKGRKIVREYTAPVHNQEGAESFERMRDGAPYVLVDDSGDSAIAADEATVKEVYEETVQALSDANGFRIVKVSVTIPLPEIVELPDIEAPELPEPTAS